MFFIKSQNENKNVLYINEKCLNCFKSLAQIKKELVNGQFIIVSATNNINFLKKIAQQNAPSVMNLVYYDPGRRFEKKLGLENINSSYVLFKKNSFKKKLKNGETRKPDVQVKDGMVQPGGGTSLFDKDKFFRGKSWNFFKLPVGTEVPPDLVLTGPAWNDYFAANHYQIEIQKPLTVEAYRQKLDHFARLAYAKAYIDAH